jgi:hypothetical protein
MTVLVASSVLNGRPFISVPFQTAADFNFKLIDTNDGTNYVADLADTIYPTQAALDCENERPRGLNAFSKC